MVLNHRNKEGIGLTTKKGHDGELLKVGVTSFEFVPTQNRFSFLLAKSEER